MIVTVGVCTCVFVCESWHQANKQQLGACISMSVLPKLNPAQWEMCSGLQRDEFLWESVSHNRTPSSHCCHARETWDLHKQLQQLYFSYSVLSWTACGETFLEETGLSGLCLEQWFWSYGLWGDWLGQKTLLNLGIIKQSLMFCVVCRRNAYRFGVWVNEMNCRLRSHLWNLLPNEVSQQVLTYSFCVA